MDFEVLLNLMVKVALLVAAGYVLKKCGILTETLEKGVSGLILKFVLPCSVIASAGSEFGGGQAMNFVLMAVIALVYYLAAIFLSKGLCKICRFQDQKRRIVLTLIVFANTAFIGYPISQELFGDEGFVYAVIYNSFYQLFFFTYGISYIRGSSEKNIWSVLCTPVNVALVVMLALIGLQIRLPAPVQDTISSVGNMMVPLSMLVIGCSLVGMRPAEMLLDKECYLVSAVRLLFFPLVTLAAVRLLQVPDPVATICVIMAGLPSGSMNVITAKEYDCEAEFAARSVVQTMVLSIFTVPLIIFLCTIVK